MNTPPVTPENILTVVQFIWITLLPMGYQFVKTTREAIDSMKGSLVKAETKIEVLEREQSMIRQEHKDSIDKLEGKIDTAINAIQDVRVAIGRLEEKGK